MFFPLLFLDLTVHSLVSMETLKYFRVIVKGISFICKALNFTDLASKMKSIIHSNQTEFLGT